MTVFDIGKKNLEAVLKVKSNLFERAQNIYEMSEQKLSEQAKNATGKFGVL